MDALRDDRSLWTGKQEYKYSKTKEYPPKSHLVGEATLKYLASKGVRP